MNIYDIQGTSLQMCALDFFSFQQARPGLKPKSACGCATKRPHLSVVSLLKSGYCTYCLLPFASLEAEKRDYEGFFSSCQIDLFTTDLNFISSRPLGRPAISTSGFTLTSPTAEPEILTHFLNSLQLDLK